MTRSAAQAPPASGGETETALRPLVSLITHTLKPVDLQLLGLHLPVAGEGS